MYSGYLVFVRDRHVLKYARVFFPSLAHLGETFRDRPQRLPFWTTFLAPGFSSSLSLSHYSGRHIYSQDISEEELRKISPRGNRERIEDIVICLLVCSFICHCLFFSSPFTSLKQFTFPFHSHFYACFGFLPHPLLFPLLHH